MYHIFDIEDTAALHTSIWNELKKLGIKEAGRSRKPTRNNDGQKRTLFNQPLELLDTEPALIMVETEIEDSKDSVVPVYAKGDVMVQVPVFIAQSCQAILKGVHTEGLFRKAGSSCRQREIKKQLEKGEGVKPTHDVVDLANILKQFLRELPEPLIPYQLHEVFLKCIQLENPEKASHTLHLACLLIPPPALAALCYLLQFFEAVASNSLKNLMDANNLSIVMAPTLMPIHISVSSRNDRQNCTKLQNYAKIIQMLIRNNTKLCGLPHYIGSKLICVSTSSLPDHDRGRRPSRDKRRNRRSSSFNRVFEGLKKIVGAKSELSMAPSTEHIDDYRSESTADLSTSPVIRNTLKRKGDSDVNIGLSNKKKKSAADIILQGKVHCTTPLTPQGHHYMQSGDNHHLYHFASPRIDLNPSPSTNLTNVENKSSVGVLRFFHRKKIIGGRTDETNALNIKTPKTTRRRLSLGRKSVKKVAINQKCDKNQRTMNDSDDQKQMKNEVSDTQINTCATTQTTSNLLKSDSIEENYDMVKQQYEVLKSHLVALEKEMVENKPQMEEEVGTPVSSSVQGAYVKTLEESEKLLLERTATEQLARQLSRGLRIRRSVDQRVIRSPSARKIGAIRRRSRDSPRLSDSQQNCVSSSRRLTRSQSMLAVRHNPSLILQPLNNTPKQMESLLPDIHQDVKISLRRGKPNTIRTGLRDPTPLRGNSLGRGHRKSLPLSDTPRSTNAFNQSPECKSLAESKRSINRNGSVMKLAKNFTAISQTSIPETSNDSAAGVYTTPEGCQWTSGDILNRHLDHIRIPLTGRPSVQKIRSENLGKVSAHVRKFDRLASPTLPDPIREAAVAVPDSLSATPHRVRSRQCAAVPRRLSSDRPVVREKSTSPKLPNISPLRESQRANALPHLTKTNDRHDVKIKASLLTPSQGFATPHNLRLRPHEVRLYKKASPLKATAPLRRSPRIAYTPV